MLITALAVTVNASLRSFAVTSMNASVE